MATRTRVPRHGILFEPVQIGPKTLHNRFDQVPIARASGRVSPYSLAAQRGIKAESGWAAVCTECPSIAQGADEAPASASGATCTS